MWHSTLKMRITVHLAKSSHKWGDLAVVGCIHISTGMHQELDHVKMTAVCCQPERRVPFLVTYIDMSTPAKTRSSIDVKGLYSSTDWETG